MSVTRKMGITLLAIILILGGIALFTSKHQDDQTRNRLTSMLHDSDQPESIPSPQPGGMNAPMPEQPQAGFPFRFPSLAQGGMTLLSNLAGGPHLEETRQSYILRVPLSEESDARAISLQVNPHHVDISGETGTHSGNSQSSSSFMQSFDTAQAVVPGKVTKKIERSGNSLSLLITIPKQTASTPTQQASPSFSPPNAMAAPGTLPPLGQDEDSPATPDNVAPIEEGTPTAHHTIF